MSEMDGYWERIAAPWLKHEAVMERILAPVAAALDAALSLDAGEAVLDIGPGSGASLARYSASVGPEGRVVGVDIARPFAERARGRTGVEVVVADAGARVVDPAAFDAVASQFGLTFFDDPVAGFTTVGRNLREAGRIVFAAWGPRAQNPLFVVPGQVAAEVLGPTEPVDPDAPGPFGLQNASRAVALLADAGFAEVRAAPVGLSLPSGLSAGELAAVQTDIGPAASRMRDAEIGEDRIAEIVARMSDAFSDYEVDGEVVLPGIVHIYSAVWPGAE